MPAGPRPRRTLAIADGDVADTSLGAVSPVPEAVCPGATRVPTDALPRRGSSRGSDRHGLRAAGDPQPTERGGEAAMERTSPLSKGASRLEFIRPVHLGFTIVAYRLLEPAPGVIPWDGKASASTLTIRRSDDYPGLAEWTRRASRAWTTHRSSDRLSLIRTIPTTAEGSQTNSRWRPTESSTARPASTLRPRGIEDARAVVEHNLYWATAFLPGRGPLPHGDPQ